MRKRIFVAIDESATAQNALEEAIDLAKAYGAALCIGHAIDEGLSIPYGAVPDAYMNIEKIRQEMRDAASVLLDKAVAKAAEAGCMAERSVVSSTALRVVDMIANAASEWKADLIVIGTHGRRGFQRMVLGSVAENLVRVSHTSVMLIRGHEG